MNWEKMMNRIIENKKLSGQILGISSKSYAHRAIFCAALSEGESILEIDNLSKDIESSLNCIKSLGVSVKEKDRKFYIKASKKFNKKVSIDVGESGTSLRFIIPILAALGIEAEIIRKGSLISRTNEVYFNLFPKHGVSLEENNERILVSGKLRDFNFKLPANVSSQFISGLMLASATSNENYNIELTTEAESKAYIQMTIDVMKKFEAKIEKVNNSFKCSGKLKGQKYIVEIDWSNALFFLAAGVEVLGLNKDSMQADKKSLKYFYELGFENSSKMNYKFIKKRKAKDKITIDAKDIPDSIPILSILSAVYANETEIINTKRLKLKESDRVKSTVEMLRNLGVEVQVYEDFFSFKGISKFKECEINSYNDHRIAMSATVAATFADGPITILDSECVEKSYKNFYEDFESLGGVCHVL